MPLPRSLLRRPRSFFDDASHLGEDLPKHRRALHGEQVGPSPVVFGQPLDEAALLEAADRAVERAGAEANARERLDVLCERVTVLGARREAREHEQRRAVQLGDAVPPIPPP
jgi:hypothetical protein